MTEPSDRDPPPERDRSGVPRLPSASASAVLGGPSFAPDEFSDLPRTADRLARLCGAALALSEASTQRAVARAVVTHGAKALGASAAALARRDGERLRLLAARGYAADLVAELRDLPVDTPIPLAECARRGEPLWLSTVSALAERYPHLVRLREDTGNRAFAALPLRLDGRVIGALVLSFSAEQRFPAEDRVFALTLAHHAAVALDRARHCEAEVARDRQLRAALEARDRFLRVAAHELNTPMTALLGHAQLLARNLTLHTAPPAQLEGAARRVVGQAQRLAHIISGLLEVARFSSGGVALAPSPTSLDTLVRQVISHRRFARLPVTVDVPTELSTDVDRAHVARALELLLENVLRHCPAGTPVELTARRHSGDPPVVELTVRDHGPGVPWGQRHELFEPFVRTERSGTSGLGAGLYVCRSIAELHGGTLVADFPRNGGTRMTLRLPG